jgi:hypothetical protein
MLHFSGATTMTNSTTSAATTADVTTTPQAVAKTTTTAVPAATTTTTAVALTNPPSSSEGTLILRFSLDEKFTPDLANPSSSAFKALAGKVVSEVSIQMPFHQYTPHQRNWI